MADITITVKLFGGFRKYGESVDFILPSGSSVRDVKSKLSEVLGGKETVLIEESAIANDNAVLGSDTIFETDTALAILPPVCGG